MQVISSGFTVSTNMIEPIYKLLITKFTNLR